MVSSCLVSAAEYRFKDFVQDITGQLFKQGLTSVKQNRILSHFRFAELFYVNTIYCEKFHESIWSRLEEHLSS